MFTKVIVGVDGLQGGRDAVALAERLAPSGALVLTCAYPYDDVPSRFALLGYGNALRDETEAQLRKIRAESGLEPARIEVLADTSPARALHHVAEREHADLLVVGSAHRGRMGRVFLGDVARAVLHGSRCPVAVAPHGYTSPGIKAVGVAYDGSAESTAALRFGASLAHDLGAALEVVQVVEPLVFALPMGGFAVDADEVYEDVRKETQAALDGVVAALDVPARATVVIGGARDRLAELTGRVDLLVTGSRGWGAVQRVVLGSTADNLIHDAPCPVVVVPRGAAVAATAPAQEARAATA